MRTSLSFAAWLLVVAFTGCAGPERKLGRGFNNLTELCRGGDIRRSMEQTALWEGPEVAYTTGFLRGFNRSVARTAIGAYEVLSFPFPPYDPLLTPKSRLYPDYAVRNKSEPWGGLVLPENPVYPQNFRPNTLADAIFDTDTSLGFSGGDIAPMVPGSRFRIFDNP
jgi:putative exosortase-associated protein (TIGR04073 family)